MSKWTMSIFADIFTVFKLLHDCFFSIIMWIPLSDEGFTKLGDSEIWEGKSYLPINNANTIWQVKKLKFTF